ncbi:DeoR/GlpR family DNA-binding transcription regulator [Kineococcus terrestris]|uniref:DeoR/GlpR family DNA-binding transcription regulator n=1 Tax=Kineococcus terrestris TaxID=2044856 RepID=UPI0034DAC098
MDRDRSGASGRGGGAGARRHGLRQAERHEAITDRVLGAGSVRIEDLAEEFGVSSMTVHRDLDALAAQGLLRKSRGVVTAEATSLFEASTEFRTRQQERAKRAVAEAAAAFVEPGQAVILDDSTTGVHLARLLPQRQPLTVITNFQRVLDELTGQRGINLISTGGQYFQWCDAYMGSVSIGALRGMRADVSFMSTSAITDDTCFHQHHDTVLVKRAMLEVARKRVLYVDSTKFQRRALHALAPLSDFDVVVVDGSTRAEDVQRLRQAGIEVVVAPPPGTAQAPGAAPPRRG